MKNHIKLSIPLLSVLVAFIILAIISKSFVTPKKANAVSPSTPFRFVIWADTETGNGPLTNASKAVNGLNPAFTLYPGDLVKCTADPGCWSGGFPAFKTALNGGGTNSIFNKTFATRGNHEDKTDTPWRSNFHFSTIASNIGATNYSALNEDMTYSFDYGNSHIVGIDMTGGDVTSMTSTQITWLDNDLKAAENRGLKHAFLFWHGPFYPVGKHCCSNPPSALVTVLNKHPIIAAAFFGHEMVLTYTHIDSGRVSGISAANEFEEFVVGNVGDGEQGSQKSGRYDYVTNTKYGFVSVDVSCNNFTVKMYKLNSSGSSPVVDKTYSFTNGSGGCGTVPTSTPTPTPQAGTSPTLPVPTTLPGECTSVTDPRDTNNPVYQAVQIGNQCWLKRNLNVGTKINTGTNPKNDGNIEKYCYNNNEANCSSRGGYYRWDETMGYSKTQGAQGICPSGWHIPTDAEQHALENYLWTQSGSSGTCSPTRGVDPADPSAKACDGAGNKLKAGGGSGFEFMLIGQLQPDGQWYDTGGGDGHFWSSTNYNSTDALNRDIDSDNSKVDRSAHEKNTAMSVRCIKNGTVSSTTPSPTQNLTPAAYITPTPIYVTPTIYCLGSCTNPTGSPSNQPSLSQNPNPSVTPTPNPTPTPIIIIIIIIVIIIIITLLRVFA